jgi:hypothetical protein
MRNDITKKLLLKLYWGQKLSQITIANRLKCGEETIRKKMIKYNIKRRNPREKIKLPIRKIINMYVNKKISLKKIGQIYNCYDWTIHNRLCENNIKTNKHGGGYTTNILAKDVPKFLSYVGPCPKELQSCLGYKWDLIKK